MISTGGISRTNDHVGLEDAILALQMISGLDPAVCPGCISSGMDINGDGAIGLADAIYILQVVSNAGR